MCDFNILLKQDPHKLVNFVCGSNYKVDGQDVAIKPDSEYPVKYFFTFVNIHFFVQLLNLNLRLKLQSSLLTMWEAS